MGGLPWYIFSFSTLFSLGLYHLVCSSRAYLRSPSPHHYAARLYYPLPHRHHLLRHLPLYLTLICLLLSALLLPLLSPPPLLLPSLRFSSALLLFPLPLLPLPLPPDLPFLLASFPFLLLSLPLHAKLSSTASFISLSSALLSAVLALSPRTFAAEQALAASVALRGLWSLQSALSLYVDAFIPAGCHRLLDVPPELSTRCELQSSRLRAADLLDLAFAIHVVLAAVLTVAVYVTVARVFGGAPRRIGSYEVLSTSASASSLGDMAMDHLQMKALGKSSAQA